MPQRPLGLDMNLSQPIRLLRPSIIKSTLLITLLKLQFRFRLFHVVLMKSVGQLACLLIGVSANTPSPVLYDAFLSKFHKMCAIVIPLVGTLACNESLRQNTLQVSFATGEDNFRKNLQSYLQHVFSESFCSQLFGLLRTPL